SALVLRTIDFSETSLVVWLFKREFGKIGAQAKGARIHNNPIESALDVLALCRIVFLHKSSEALDLVTEAKLLRRFRPTGRNLAGLYAGYYVAELLGDLTDENDPHPELFDLADETLAALAAGEVVHRRLARFELGALRFLGHTPALEQCAECGTKIELAGRIAFGGIHGGALCRECRKGKSNVVSVSAGVLRTLAQLADLEAQSWRRMEIDARMLGELRGVLNHYIANLLGRKPRMYDYLHEFWR
ncbi:MAG: DNA repair protein RecO, partial [Thermoguttaceae bacterium]